MYNMFVRPSFGKLRIASVKKSDVKRFYNTLADEKILTIATIDNIHTVDVYKRQRPDSLSSPSSPVNVW